MGARRGGVWVVTGGPRRRPMPFAHRLAART
jgi:hypothetical protein